MILPILAVVGGLIVLVISSDRFVDGAAASALGMSISLKGESPEYG